MSDGLNTKILIQIRDKISGVEEGLDRLREEHGEILREHGEHLDAVEEVGRTNGMILRQVLGAVEYGNKQWDTRLGRIEEYLDLPPAKS